MKEAHVIQCNDAVMAVAVGVSDEIAEQIKERLAAQDFERNKGHWEHQAQLPWVYPKNAYHAYRNRLYWHVRTVPLVDVAMMGIDLPQEGVALALAIDVARPDPEPNGDRERARNALRNATIKHDHQDGTEWCCLRPGDYAHVRKFINDEA
jgi:hypothetical protein